MVTNSGSWRMCCGWCLANSFHHNSGFVFRPTIQLPYAAELCFGRMTDVQRKLILNRSINTVLDKAILPRFLAADFKSRNVICMLDRPDSRASHASSSESTQRNSHGAGQSQFKRSLRTTRHTHKPLHLQTLPPQNQERKTRSSRVHHVCQHTNKKVSTSQTSSQLLSRSQSPPASSFF